MSLFNREQEEHMNELAANPDKVCKCGWYWKFECSVDKPAKWCPRRDLNEPDGQP